MPQVQGFTIDGATSKDLDDAIWAEQTPDGYRLTISISDAARDIPRGTDLDLCAAQRVETLYFRDWNKPMLPRVLSEARLSLLPQQPRRVLAVVLDLDRDGRALNTHLLEARLISSARLSHQDTDTLLRNPQTDSSLPIALCQEIASHLLAHRQARGACAFYDLFRGYYTDEEGIVHQYIGPSIHAQVIVQEFMITANEAVAAYMAGANRNLIYRNHQARAAAPDRETLLRQVNDALLHPQSLPALSRRLHLWAERARYSPALLGHFGLNLPAYAHFTSPIRRYADLVNHRLVKALLRGEPEPYSREELDQISASINAWKDARIRATEDHFHQTALQARREAMAAPQAALAIMDTTEFGRALEQALKDDAPHEGLLRALRPRAQQGDLLPADLHHLFFRGGAAWTESRRLALEGLQAQPSTAIALLDILRTKDQGEITYHITPTRDGGFKGQVSVIREGHSLLTATAPATHSTKKSAQGHAALAWLQGFLDETLSTDSPSEATDTCLPQPLGESIPALTIPEERPFPGASPDDPWINYIGLMNETCQKRRAPAPVYLFTEEGPSHVRSFTCTVHVLLRGETLQITGPASPTKQEAKRLAARNALAQIQALDAPSSATKGRNEVP